MTGTGNVNLGVQARYIDANNNLTATINVDGTSNVATLSVVQFVAGVTTSSPIVQWTHTASATYYVRLIAYATGKAIGQALNSSGAILAETFLATADLVTGGTL